ncbi:MAG: integrase [Bacilli bacterium]|nr:integrase [Bacilli bacterium]
MEPIKLHEFRHSCVSNLLASGLPVRVVARWVGDTEEVILQTYSHLIPDEKDQIAQFIGSLSGTPTISQ